jgi:transposase
MTVEQLTQELQQRDAQLADREAQITELSESIDKLRRQVAWCERQLFGRKSERYEDPNQSSLFAGHAISRGQGEAGAVGEAEASKVTVPSHQRRTSRRGKREPIPDDLPREVIVHDVPEAERIDPETGEVKLIRIGEEVSETLAFEPGKMYAKRHVRLKYRRVEENLIGDAPEVVIAAAPREGLAKCLADGSLLAEITVGKFVDHLPLDRQVKIFRRRFGVELSKASMCRWMQMFGELALPLLELMKRLMLSHSRIIQHDDTPVRQQEPGRGQTRQCRFWTAVGDRKSVV